jgi:hypothetical protein
VAEGEAAMKAGLAQLALSRLAAQEIRARGLLGAAAFLRLSPAVCLSLAINESTPETEASVALSCGCLLSAGLHRVELPS